MITVSDDGMGIPESELSRVKEAFYMVDKSRSRKEHGAGLGLALCDKIISLHNGHMDIDSVLGEGTTVSIYL
jgi:signal transduction histidine kinase